MNRLSPGPDLTHTVPVSSHHDQHENISYRHVSQQQLDSILGFLAGIPPAGVSISTWLMTGNEVLEVLRYRDLPGSGRSFADLTDDQAATTLRARGLTARCRELVGSA